MTLAFVVPVTRPADASALVACLAPCSREKGWEIILVTGEPLPGIGNEARQIVTPELHASVRRNLGVKATEAEWIAFLDDDTLPLPGWFQALEASMADEHPIVTGPTVPMGDGFDETLTDLVTTSPLGEGSLLYGSGEGSSPSFSSIYLCNCLVRRRVWSRVGGFNELADWRVDDTEFFYIALRLGFKPVFRRDFTVKHRRRGFFRGFLKHQFRARFATGMNTVIFPEIFLRIPGVLAMLAGLGLLPFLIGFPVLLPWAGILYGAALALDALSRIPGHPAHAPLLPPAHLVHHAVIGSAFTLGLVHTLLTRGRHRRVLAHRARRYRVFP